MSNAEFDQFSREYQDLLDRSVAFAGESSEYFAEYKAAYVARLLGSKFAGKILDYGCGIGLLSRFLRRHLPNATVHGFDLSSESISLVDRELMKGGLFTTDRDSLHADYVAIVIANVMHHVPADARQRTVSQLGGMLARAGNLFVFEHNPWNPVTRWVVNHCPFDKEAVLLRPREVRSYITNAALKVVRRDYIVFFPRILSRMRDFEPSLSWLPLGAQYCVIGRKSD